ncbi:MAG TPA: glycoside hydrolase family 16 protein [Acidimicrobiales bacterium]|nr:glycoside hydrolase family 16 protein [Acidimicrobiales bacterium]
MSQPGGNRRTRAWVLANVVAGVVLIVVLSLVFIGTPGSGQADANGPGAPDVGSPGPGGCTLFQRMVDTCANATTTTTTSSSPSAGPAARGDGSTTYSSTQNGAPGGAGTPHAAAPAAPATSPGSGAPPAPADTGPCAGTAPPVAAPSGSWRCTFDDEFNGSSLDGSKWSPMLTYASAYRTGPLFHQVCYVDNPDTINVSGGTLNLSVVQSAQPIGCQGTSASKAQTNIEGGMVISYNLFSQEYGFFEASAEMPATNVPGLQETLWLYPQNETLYGPWPDSGEIDYGEFYSEYPNNDVPAIHYPGSSSDPNSSDDNCVHTGSSPAGQFHTYAALWTPTSITTYYDGQPCMTDVYGPYVNNPDTAPEPFDQPFFLALTAALGAANGDQYRPGVTPLPATTKIDWVRSWQYG